MTQLTDQQKTVRLIELLRDFEKRAREKSIAAKIDLAGFNARRDAAVAARDEDWGVGGGPIIDPYAKEVKRAEEALLHALNAHSEAEQLLEFATDHFLAGPRNER